MDNDNKKKRKMHAFSQNQADEFNSNSKYSKLELDSDYKMNNLSSKILFLYTP